MGTRSLTRVFDSNGSELLCMYRQYDGYLSGHGAELAKFLTGGEVVDGLSYRKTSSKLFNGAECLAAQLVAWFKISSLVSALPLESAYEEVAQDISLLESVPGREVALHVRNALDKALARLKLREGVGAGGIYIYPAGSKDCGEDYTYEIHVGTPGTPLRILAIAEWRSSTRDNILYDGDLPGFTKMIHDSEED